MNQNSEVEDQKTSEQTLPEEHVSDYLKDLIQQFKIDFQDDIPRSTTRKVIKIDKSSEKASQLFKMDQIEIRFPYKTIYEPQKSYMTKVIEAIADGKNALLQSPTGTGKTMSLLCSTMAWLKIFQEKCMREENIDLMEQTKIIYATRTHAQVRQVVNQLKKTCYRPVTCVLGSRNQSCLKNYKTGFLDENNVMRKVSGGQLITACKSARTALFADPPVDEEYKCRYFLPFSNGRSAFFDAKKVKNPMFEKFKDDKVRDIEDVLDLGEKCGFCPLYFERYLLEDSDIIVMPYNYLLDPNLRKMHDIDLRNKIVIIDEAHNIERAAEDSVSFDLSLRDLENAQIDIFGFLKTLKSQNRNPPPFVYTALTMIETLIQNMKILNDHFKSKEYEKMAPGQEILELFENVPPDDDVAYEDINEKIKAHVDSVFDTLYTLVEFMGDIPKFFGGGGVSYLVRGMKIIKKFCGRDYSTNLNPERKKYENYLEAYRLFYTIPDPKNPTLVLKLQCMDPSICFEEILEEKPRSLLLTSGTLEPMKSFEEELKVPFAIKLVNKHIIDTTKQCQTMIFSTGLKNSAVPINFTYKEAENIAIYREVGGILITLAKLIKNGILIAFASHRIMEKCFEVWQSTKYLEEETTYFQKLSSIKSIYREPKDGQELKIVMQEYFNDARTEKGAILCCVCRGKISEGIDFADEKARAVVLIGVPLLSSQALEVSSKKEFLDKKCAGKHGLSGKDWYNQQAIRAFNQAIGRVIRHQNDYGAVFLLDDRYTYPYFKDLPNWIQDNVHKIQKEGEFIMKTHRFFSEAVKLNLEKKESLGEDNDDTLEELEEPDEWGSTKAPQKTMFTGRDLFFGGARKYRNRKKQNAVDSNTPDSSTTPEKSQLKRKVENELTKPDLKQLKSTAGLTQPKIDKFFTQFSQSNTQSTPNSKQTNPNSSNVNSPSYAKMLFK